MESFANIYARAAERKGGAAALDALLNKPKTPAQVKRLTDAEVLAEMTKCVFRSGFVWKIIEAKWPAFEREFAEFDVNTCAMLSDEDLERLSQNPDIVRNGKKIASVRGNAHYIQTIRETHGSFGAFLAGWPVDDFVGLWDHLKQGGERLGGQTGRFFLRFVGWDSPMLSNDVVRALVAAGVVEKTPSSKRALAATQGAFNTWRAESGRSLTEISRTLAMSVSD